MSVHEACFFDPESDDWESPKYLQLLRQSGVRVVSYEDLEDYWDEQEYWAYLGEDDCS